MHARLTVVQPVDGGEVRADGDDGHEDCECDELAEDPAALLAHFVREQCGQETRGMRLPIHWIYLKHE